MIDSHVHLTHGKFDRSFHHVGYDPASDAFAVEEGDRASLVEAIRRQGIAAVVEPGVDLASNRRLLELAARHPGWPRVGAIS